MAASHSRPHSRFYAHLRFVTRHLLCGLFAVLFAALFATVAAAQPETSAAPNQAIHFSIPAGPLAKSLNQFAAVTGMFVSGNAHLTQNKTSNRVEGTYEPIQALQLLLLDTGVTYQISDARTVMLVPAASQYLSPVAVHSTLQGDPIEERMSLSSAKIIIGKEEIEAFGDASMGEVIRRMPSISFGGPPGENNDARIRGLNKEYTQILIDGQPVPGREFAIDQIPAHLVERLEIIRTTTANIDNQGIAGTVNIILKKAPKERNAKWTAGAGTTPDAFNDGKTANLGMTYGNALENFRYQVDATLQNRVGVRTKDRQDYNNGLSILTNREQDFEMREHEEAAFSSRLNWKLNNSDEFRLDPRYTYSSENKERDRLKKADLSEAERMDQIKTRQYAGLNGQWQRSIDNDARYILGFNVQKTLTELDKEERKGSAGQEFTALPTFASGNDDEIKENSTSLRASTQLRVMEHHALDMGIEVTRMEWDMNKQGWKREDRSDHSSSDFAVTEDKLAVYIQDEILIGELHVLTPGLRLEYVNTETRVNREEAEKADHLQPSPSLHWLSTLNETSNWRASITRSIRRPKFEDLSAIPEVKSGTVDDPDKIGNPDLEPETAWAAETSFEHYFNERAGVASINLFHRKISDVIERRIIFNEETERYEQQPINIAKAETWGIELDGSYRFALGELHNLILRGNYSWLDSRVDDPILNRSRSINDQPENILNLGVDYEYRPWKLKLGTNFNQVGRLQKADAVGANYRLQEQEPSRYLDIYLLMPLAKDLNLRISGTNLLEAEKNRPRTTTRPDGSVALFEQEDEASAKAIFIKLEGRF